MGRWVPFKSGWTSVLHFIDAAYSDQLRLSQEVAEEIRYIGADQ